MYDSHDFWVHKVGSFGNDKYYQNIWHYSQNETYILILSMHVFCQAGFSQFLTW